MNLRRFLHRSVLIPLVCMVFLIGYLGVGLSMGPLILPSGLTNENFIPVIISIIGILLCISIMKDSLKEMDDEEPVKEAEPKFGLKQIILFADFFLFIGLYSLVGFIPAAFVFTLIFMVFFDDKVRGLLKKLIISIIITAVVYILYAVVFGVRFN